jgi:hypothetical protein
VGWVTATDTGVVEPPVDLVVVEVSATDVDDELELVLVDDALFLSLLPQAAVRATRATATGSSRTERTSPTVRGRRPPKGPPSLAGFAARRCAAD